MGPYKIVLFSLRLDYSGPAIVRRQIYAGADYSELGTRFKASDVKALLWWIAMVCSDAAEVFEDESRIVIRFYFSTLELYLVKRSPNSIYHLPCFTDLVFPEIFLRNPWFIVLNPLMTFLGLWLGNLGLGIEYPQLLCLEPEPGHGDF